MLVVYKLGVSGHFCPLGSASGHFSLWGILALGVLLHFPPSDVLGLELLSLYVKLL